MRKCLLIFVNTSSSNVPGDLALQCEGGDEAPPRAPPSIASAIERAGLKGNADAKAKTLGNRERNQRRKRAKAKKKAQASGGKDAQKRTESDKASEESAGHHDDEGCLVSFIHLMFHDIS